MHSQTERSFHFRGKKCFKISKNKPVRENAVTYRTYSIKPPGGAHSFQTHLRGGLKETERLIWEGAFFNLTKTMVSVLQKELEYKVENLKYKELEVVQPKIKNKSELPGGEQTIPAQSTWNFIVVID